MDAWLEIWFAFLFFWGTIQCIIWLESRLLMKIISDTCIPNYLMEHFSNTVSVYVNSSSAFGIVWEIAVACG